MRLAAMVRQKENADMGKKKNAAEATTDAEIPTTEIPIESATAPEAAIATEETTPEPKPKKARKKKFEDVATLADLAAAYATQMESDGKSNGTIASYGMELKVAQD